jgi:hypothetical protein
MGNKIRMLNTYSSSKDFGKLRNYHAYLNFFNKYKDVLSVAHT